MEGEMGNFYLGNVNEIFDLPSRDELVNTADTRSEEMQDNVGVIDEEEAEILQMILATEMAAEGTKKIEEDFNVDGVILASSCIVAEDQRKMERALAAEVPEFAASENRKRFKTLSETELQEIKDSRTSKSTKKNTKWGVNVLQEWSLEANGHELDLMSVTPDELNNHLCRFYVEATPKADEKRLTKMNAYQATEYHKSSFKSIRSAINRHLKDNNRDIDIVRDKVFKEANEHLDAKLKFNLKHGLSRPIEHKPIIPPGDLMKISTYLSSEESPVILRFRVWYDISIHFVTRGLEMHQQLTPQSFLFLRDENNTDYVTLCHETKQKNWQGGLDNPTNISDKRMYTDGTDRCPVKALKLFLLKTDPSASSLFNHCTKEALANHKNENIWYSNKPVKAYQFTRFMADICKNSHTSSKYTAHSLRATAIQNLNDAGFETRHIMYMSGHRNESSLRS